MMFGSLLKRLTTSLQEIRRIVNNLLNRFDLPLASAPIDWDPFFHRSVYLLRHVC
ncbi:hypothetical protein BDN71DRAFT_1442737 [Pleurotus eryngii]|uniref:Uncharacterized protein n=1 Tax=Pleurotus eryngii TaxID=5323 RepID=A0A9P6A7X4_PLEER|nr:hypothetical protein BDN71DRAFT_1442737 [Pleurotus eryngii]